MINIIFFILVSAFFLQYLSSFIVMFRMRNHARRSIPSNKNAEIVTIIRPCSGADPFLEQTIRSGFQTGDWPCKFIFCIASENDPARPILEKLVAEHPNLKAEILIGDSNATLNPKLNNLMKSWDHIESDYALIVDSNVLFEPDYLPKLMTYWHDNTALVSAPPAGILPENFAARIEAAFLNTYQDRWFLAGAAAGQGYAQGKVLFWRKSALKKGGGFEKLGNEMAEDVASTKLVKSVNMEISVLAKPVNQPLGKRTLKAVIDRQNRWAKIRRLGFPLLYIIEALSLPMLPLGILALFLICIGASFPVFVLLLFIWYLPEYLLAQQADWPRSWKDVLAWPVRDIISPLIWVSGFFGNTFSWHGHKLDLETLKQQKPKK